MLILQQMRTRKSSYFYKITGMANPQKAEKAGGHNQVLRVLVHKMDKINLCVKSVGEL